MAKYAILIYEDPAFYANASPEAWGAVCAMASEGTKLFPALLSAEPQPRVTSSVGSVHAAAWKNRGRITVLAANTLDKPQAVRLRLEGIGIFGRAINLQQFQRKLLPAGIVPYRLLD